MTHSENIKNWLTIAFRQPTGSLMESFYFDTLNNHFFSIIFFDLLLLDNEDSDKADFSYNQTQVSLLVDKMKKIENKDKSIISIPRISLDDRISLMKSFVSNLDEVNSVKKLEEKIEQLNDKDDFDFGDDINEFIRTKWNETRQTYLLNQVDSFLESLNVNLENTTIIQLDSNVSITVDLEDENQKKQIVKNKIKSKYKWWLFW